MIFLCKKPVFCVVRTGKSHLCTALCIIGQILCFLHRIKLNLHRNLLFSRTIKNYPYFLDTYGDHRYNFTVDTLLIYYVKAIKR